MVQQIAIFGVNMPAAHGDLLAIGGKFEFIDEIHHAVSSYQQVEIGRVFKGEHILFLGFEIENGLQGALNRFRTVDVHR